MRLASISLQRQSIPEANFPEAFFLYKNVHITVQQEYSSMTFHLGLGWAEENVTGK